MYRKGFRVAASFVAGLLPVLFLCSCALIRPSIGYEKIVLGENSEKLPVYLATLRNGGAEVSISNLGARIRSLKVPDRSGRLCEVLRAAGCAGVWEIGNDTVCGMLTAYPPASQASHILAEYVWRMEPFRNDDEVGVRMSRRPARYGPDKLGPGYIEVVYSLSSDRELRLEYSVRGVDPGMRQLCNPLLFNLSGSVSDTVIDQQAAVISSIYCPPDSGHIAVEDSPFDLRQPELIGRQIELMGSESGLKGRWMIGSPERDIDLAASLYNPGNGIYLEIFTDKDLLEVDTVSTARLAGEAPNSSISFIPLSSGNRRNSAPDGLHRSQTIYRFSTI